MHALRTEAGVPASGRFALWQLGFRPFYLLASLFAAASVPLWVLQFTGRVSPAGGGPVGHAHEMIFGFALAVIVGFLFTAGRNWTGRPTPTGVPLAVLAGLWLAARVLALTPFLWAAGAANVTFAWAAAAALAVPLARARNRRNAFFVVLLVVMGAASGAIHLAQLGVTDLAPLPVLRFSLGIVLFIVAVMAGRVVPMFTNNGVRGASATRSPAVERAALGGLLLLVAADLSGLRGAPVALLAALLALVHGARWLLWQPWKVRRVPLVWVLHLAYLWVPVHLVLRALGELNAVAPSLATHALTAGAIGIMIIGMMTRTARGHTARALVADGWDTACYLLVFAAALARVGVPLLLPSQWLIATGVSAVLWSAGFGLFAVRYWPVLTRPRLDGRPG